MHPLGDRLGGLDGEAVRVERLGVLARRLQLSKRRVASSPTVTTWNATTSTSPRLDGAEVVGEAEPLAPFLPREVEARDLAQRAAVARVRGRVVDDDVVARRDCAGK